MMADAVSRAVSAEPRLRRPFPWVVVGWAVVAALLAVACGSTEPGVSVGQAQQSSATDNNAGSAPAGTVPADPSSEGTAPPDSVFASLDTAPDTVPNTTDPPEPSSTEPNTTEPIEDDGPSGIGDKYFPDTGNPGLDVIHYDLDLAYDPASPFIEATVTLSVAATSTLDSFTLDQVGLDISSVTVDGVEAEFAAKDPELWITPPVPIATGAEFEVVVAYSTDPTSVDPAAGINAGWFPTELGSFVLNEPDGARTWLPSNDHPSDKATYRFAIHLPDDYTGVANGNLESSDVSVDGGRIWIWNQPEPMTTYLIQLLTGPLAIIDATTSEGLPLTHVLLTDDVELMQPFLDVTSEQIDFFDDVFGPYPFDSYGIAITDANFGGAIEDQGRSLFSRDIFLSGSLDYVEQLFLAHELAHQWFGNAVSPARWQDIWLNESFASYGEWLWLDHTGYLDLAETAQFHLTGRQDGSIPTGDPGVDSLFGAEVYYGGAVVLQALRLTIGDDRFFELLQRWISESIDTSRTTEDFIALAESISESDLGQFFDEWLYATDLPDAFPT